MTIRIVIADDHQVVRRGLRTFLELDPELVVVGEAADGAEAVRLAQHLQPDIVLMDLLMPVMDGIAATAAIRRELPETEVLALTSVLEDASVVGAVRAGAIGYLLKDTEADGLCRAIKAAVEGAGAVDAPGGSALDASRERPGKSTAAHRTGDRRPAEAFAGPGEQADRAQLTHCREDGQGACQQHPGQARGAEPHPGHPLRHPHRPGLGQCLWNRGVRGGGQP